MHEIPWCFLIDGNVIEAEMQFQDRSAVHDFQTRDNYDVSTRLRVLVVDDEKDTADTLSAVLESMGHDAYVAYDGEAAVKLAFDVQPECILLDLGMPTMSGFAVVGKMKSQAWGQRAKFIAVTGWDGDEERNRCIEAGFFAHLTKPVNMELLKGLLSRV